MADVPQSVLWGVISTHGDPRQRCAAALGQTVINLAQYCTANRASFNTIASGNELVTTLQSSTLNHFAALPPDVRSAFRLQLIRDFADGAIPPSCQIALAEVITHLPMKTNNYVDFYCSLEHAQNCAKLAGGGVGTNFYNAPMCYNGRASSIVPSATDIRRPRGVYFDTGESDGLSVSYAPSKKLDFELEVGYLVSRPVPHGTTLAIENAPDYIFGFVLLNDWSARDFQAFEMRPLGPFHSKGFGTSISSWVVPLDILEPFATSPRHDHHAETLPHLRWAKPATATFDVTLRASIVRDGERTLVTRSNLRDLYWSPYQQLTHLAAAGCGMSPGDLIGTGTVSGEHEGSRGCLFEATEDGTKPLQLNGGKLLGYLEDGDEVILEAYATGSNAEPLVHFGECRGTVLAAVR